MYNADKVIMGAPSEVFIDGVNVGWTRGGIRLRTTKSYWYRNSLSGLGAEGAVKEDESFYISTVMVESLLDSVKKAWGINESIDYSTSEQGKLQFGGSTAIPTHVVRFSGPGRRVVFYKAVAIDFGEIQYTKNSEVLTPITFRVLLDTSKSVGNMVGYFLDGITDGYSNLICRATVFFAESLKNLVCRAVILKENSKNLISRVTTLKESSSNLVSRLIVRVESSENLICQLTVAYAPGTFDLVSRATVLKESSSDLVSRVTVTYAPGTFDLVSRVTVLKESSNNLVSRSTVLKETSNNLVSQVTVVYAQGSSNLVSRVTVTSP